MEHRDGIKIKGDKVRMPCTHSTVIYKTCNSQPKRINDTSPIMSQHVQHNLSILVDRLIYPQQARQTVALAAVTLDCEGGNFCHVPNVMCQSPPLLNVNLMLSMTLTCLQMPPSVIYLFSFQRTGTAFWVIVQFRGRLM